MAPTQSFHPKILLGFFLALAIQIQPVAADDWPQWQGPQRDSVWRESGILKKFPEGGPVVKWRVPISGGYSGPAVVKDRVFVMDYVTTGDQTPDPNNRNVLEGTERVLCFDRETGELLWKHEYDCPYEISYPAGPRCTPTVDSNLVYTLGAEGDLRCLDVENGNLIWDVNFKRDFNAKTPLWGFSGHPLIDGNKIICVAGGPEAVAIALDKRTGKLIWQALSAQQPGYAPPTIIEAGGTRQLLIWHSESLNSLNPETGDVYWSEPLDPNYGMSIITPRLDDNLLFVGAIVNKSMVLKMDSQRPTASVEWYGQKDKGIDPVNASPIAEEGFLYGVDRQGQLSCVKMINGEIMWRTFELMPEQRRAQSGTVFLVKHEDRFFLFTDSGDLVIARLSPSNFKFLDRAQILPPTGDAFGRSVLWSHPAFSNRCMFARNDKELICISLEAGE